MVVALPPLDDQRAAGELHRGCPLRSPLQDSRHHSRAGARAACQGWPRAALPHAHLQVRGRHHLCEFGIDPGRERRIVLKERPDLSKVELVHLKRAVIPLEHHGVRVAHAHGRDGPGDAVNVQSLRDGCARLGVGLEGGRHLGRLEDGLAHVDADLPIRQDVGYDETRQRVHLVGLRAAAVDVRDKPREAADPVAAHLGLAAVRVEDSHGVVRVADGWESKDDAITADPEVPVT
mmetsp:Transcript_43680/g.111654  ORF Transcript_43680/g.111654 Transcript_43680/m.111654 type:complete len:234 (+) Transcript_43680:216-917(+)